MSSLLHASAGREAPATRRKKIVPPSPSSFPVESQSGLVFLSDPKEGIPSSAVLPNIQFIQGNLHGALRAKLKGDVHWINSCLQQAFINDHSFAHMDRVARGVYDLGVRMNVDHRDLMMATLASRFHDCGYEFDRNASPQDIARTSKEIHARHAERGAEMFVDAFEQVRRDPAIAKMTDWVTDRHIEVAHQSIALHNNRCSVDPNEFLSNEVHVAGLLTRAIDKLDNSRLRVHPMHLEILARAPHFSIQHIQRCVRDGAREVLLEGGARCRQVPLDAAREAWDAVNPTYRHRTVPGAIESQEMYYQADDGTLEVEYAAYPETLGQQLGTTYAPEAHFADLREVYGKSFAHVAHVLHVCRARLQGIDRPGDPMLTIRVHYNEDGAESILSYSAQGEVPQH